MRKPKVDLDHLEQVRAFFAQQDPDPRVLAFVHEASSFLFKPQVEYDQGTKAAVEGHLEWGGQIILALRHRRAWDPLIVAAMLKQESAFNTMMGHTVIPAKAPLFGWPIVGQIVSYGGAIPVFRKKDVQRRSDETDTELNVRRKQTNAATMSILEVKINDHKHGAIFPEGTRNKAAYRPDSTQVQPLHDGIWTIVNEAKDVNNLMIVTASTEYGEVEMTKRHARIALSHVPALAHNKENLLADVSQKMQTAADLAAAKAWSPFFKTWI